MIRKIFLPLLCVTTLSGFAPTYAPPQEGDTAKVRFHLLSDAPRENFTVYFYEDGSTCKGYSMVRTGQMFDGSDPADILIPAGREFAFKINKQAGILTCGFLASFKPEPGQTYVIHFKDLYSQCLAGVTTADANVAVPDFKPRRGRDAWSRNGSFCHPVKQP